MSDIHCNTFGIMAKKAKPFGLDVPEKANGEIITFRLKGVDVKRLEKLAKRVKVGRSTMARLIIEKFINEHDPEKGR